MELTAITAPHTSTHPQLATHTADGDLWLDTTLPRL